LHDAENVARVQADLRRAMSEALNRAETTADVAHAITLEGQRAFGAAGLAVSVVDVDDATMLRLESRSGLDGATIADSVPIDQLRSGELSEWTSPWFITDERRAADALAGLVEGIDWAAAALLPLGLTGRELGLIAVGFEDAEDLTSAVRVALSGVTAEASVALGRARRSDIAHDIAVTLQRSLLPVIQPLSPEWAASTWYEPGSELVVVGGDLFDVTELEDGRIVIVVGDVVGHGLEAAASMGLLRSAAKALTLVRSRPADVISGLQAFAAVTPGVRYASVCCVEVRPEGRGRYASAGHPFPVLRYADGRTEVLEGGRSPLLGITAAAPSDAAFRVPVGSTLVMYTDGLIDRRGTTSQDELRRLREFVGRQHFPDTTARHVVEHMLGDSPTQDDIVVVCLTRTRASPGGATEAADD
jgi:serine phosphatase RsbU (regulator of sigma subunit)